MNKIKLAIDLDKTIINYDDLFHKVARNKLRIQSNIKNKENIKKLIIKKYSVKKMDRNSICGLFSENISSKNISWIY